jgi:sporulation integral membrane protein YlbJ
VSNIIIAYDGIYIYSKFLGSALCRPLRLPRNCSFVLIISLLCGYPLGAKYACDLYEKNIINLKTCERLLNIASNASPLFVLGSVGISMLKDSNIGYILLISNILSCIAMGLFLPSHIYEQKNGLKGTHTYSDSNIGNVLKSSIENSIKTCVSIGGFVTLFSVVNNILLNNYLFNSIVYKLSLSLNVSKDILQGFLLGIIEMTNGCNLVSSSNSSMVLKIALVSFLFTFSGLSIIAQVYSFTYKFNISMKKYALRKILQSISCSVISVSFYIFFYLNKSQQSFNMNYKGTTWLQHRLLLVFLCLIILPWFVFKIKKLFHIS